jgi:hypothetical protein
MLALTAGSVPHKYSLKTQLEKKAPRPHPSPVQLNINQNVKPHAAWAASIASANRSTSAGDVQSPTFGQNRLRGAFSGIPKKPA